MTTLTTTTSLIIQFPNEQEKEKKKKRVKKSGVKNKPELRTRICRLNPSRNAN